MCESLERGRCWEVLVKPCGNVALEQFGETRTVGN